MSVFTSCGTMNKLSSRLSYNSYDLHGLKIEYSSNTSVKISKFKGGKQNGISTIYFSNGEKIIAKYKNGVVDGKKYFFNSNGEFYKIEKYNFGQMTGFEFYTPPVFK